jgi:hypothetical protein
MVQLGAEDQERLTRIIDWVRRDHSGRQALIQVASCIDLGFQLP